MSLSIKAVSTICQQYQKEVDELVKSQNETNPFLQKLTLQKIRIDIPRLLNAVASHKTSKFHDATRSQVLDLSNQVEDLVYENTIALKEFAAQHEETKPPTVVPEVVDQPPATDDDYTSLRKRLLAEGKTTSFDNEHKEQMNDYHESFQEEIITDLTALASTLKSSAQTLSSKIMEDSKLVQESGENMARSSGLMQAVGSNLNSYLSEKSGGKISLFFMIKTMAFVFVLFFCMVVLTKILPKM